MKEQAGYTDSEGYRSLEDLRREATDLYLCYCGMEECRPGHAFGPEVRQAYVLHFVEKGKGIFRAGELQYRVEGGEAFMIEPGIETYYRADEASPWKYRWIGFQGLKAFECVSSAGFSSKTPVRSIGCMEVVTDCIEGMLKAHRLTYENELKRTSELYRLFSALVGEQAKERGPGIREYAGSVYAQKAVDYLRLNYNKRIRIQELADYIGINRGYLAEAFKKVTGTTAREYLLDLRMEKAASLLRQTELPVREIALRVGYEDQLAFSRMFKLKYKAAPKAYREAEITLVERGEKGYEREKPL